MRTIAAISLLLALLVPTVAQADDHALGLRLGMTYSVLDQPADEPGDVTFMAGTAFSGVGLAVALTYEWSGLRPLVLETGLVFARAAANGFQIRGEQQREAAFEADTLRLPLWAKYELGVGPVRVRAGGGPEVLFGLTSAAEIREVNVPAEDAAVLETRSVTSVQLTGVLDVAIETGKVDPSFSVHASVNPLTGAKTADRFENEEAGVPSQLRAEFDYEFLFLLGVAYDL